MGVDIDEWKKVLPSKKGPMYWDASGVWHSEPDARGKTKTRQLTPRPILPTARGIDQDDGLWLRVSWEDWRGNERSQWMPDIDARNPKILEALPGAPIDPTCSRIVARWMSCAPAKITSPDAMLATRLGWIDDKFVWPGHLCGREWVGTKIDSDGSAQKVADAIRMLVSLPGESGFLALAVVGMSAASPLVRWGCVRNPIIGLAQRSSRGKGTAINLALSLWGNPEIWRLPSGSNVKGTQDKGTLFPDTPLFLDDLHNLWSERPDLAQELIYYCGNGQRRVTSSRMQIAKGGEMRRGVSFYGSEWELLSGAKGGVQMRAWELTGDPMPDAATARAIEEATEGGMGAAGPGLARFYSQFSPAYWKAVLATDRLGDVGAIDTSSLSTGDVGAMRCLAHGLIALRQTLSIMDLDPRPICSWLTSKISNRRAAQIDVVQAAWEDVIQKVLGGQWGKHVADNGDLLIRDENRLYNNSEVVAWRVPAMHQEESWNNLDINIGCSFLGRVITRYGLKEAELLKEWSRRGLIERNAAYYKWQIRDQGRIAMRVSKPQLDHWTGPGDPDVLESASPMQEAGSNV